MTFSPLAAFGVALAAMATPAAVLAQTDTSAPVEAPAALFTLDTPIEALMADDRAKAVLAKHLGPVDQHPAYEQFKTLSLRVLAPYSQGMISDETLVKIEADLTAIK
ncbi:hypothetical protein CHX26_02255 [Porphyrobacter sp. HT-58-2]|uniref:hypothetical protein n=1 Tax=Porphyrobacter sp. HT-58-2 TaxID=2023229 RepID=UPI000CDCDDDE|nr:hypothetical protein [Porphyrobacter sp. HT-58-2]AUX68492.1 hypothetical protein CHX26_02255 [Porphyrobacter sp. HT-58-2]